LDRATGRPIRRYERERPGELVHVDIKKLGNIREVAVAGGEVGGIRARPGRDRARASCQALRQLKGSSRVARCPGIDAGQVAGYRFEDRSQ
ncbi:hypothetical protein ACFV2Q_31125, partial [Streptomyces sp. NPDC059650]